MTLNRLPLSYILVFYVQNIICQQSGGNQATNLAINNLIQQQLQQKCSGPNTIMANNNQTSMNSVPNSNILQQTNSNMQLQQSNIQRSNANMQQSKLNSKQQKNVEQSNTNMNQQQGNIQQPNANIQQSKPIVKTSSSPQQSIPANINTFQMPGQSPCQNVENPLIPIPNSNARSPYQPAQNQVTNSLSVSSPILASGLSKFLTNSCSVKETPSNVILLGNRNDIGSIPNIPFTINGQSYCDPKATGTTSSMSNLYANNLPQIPTYNMLPCSIPPTSSVTLPQKQMMITLQNPYPYSEQQQKFSSQTQEQIQSLQNQLRFNEAQSQLISNILSSHQVASSCPENYKVQNLPCYCIQNSPSNVISNPCSIRNPNLSSIGIQNYPTNNIQNLPCDLNQNHPSNSIQNAPYNLIQNPPHYIQNQNQVFQSPVKPINLNVQGQQDEGIPSPPLDNQQSISSMLLSYLMQCEGSNPGCPVGPLGPNNNVGGQKPKSSLKSLVPLLLNLLNDRGGDCGCRQNCNCNGVNCGGNMNTPCLDPTAAINTLPANEMSPPSNQMQAPPLFLTSNDAKEYSGSDKSRGFRESQKVQEYYDSDEYEYYSEEDDEFSKDYD